MQINRPILAGGCYGNGGDCLTVALFIHQPCRQPQEQATEADVGSFQRSDGGYEVVRVVNISRHSEAAPGHTDARFMEIFLQAMERRK